ncbi:hypothetical protein VPH35_129934 [Triticum aestivum]
MLMVNVHAQPEIRIASCMSDWFLNRKKDYKDMRFSRVISNAVDMKLRDDLERLKKIIYNLVVPFSSILGSKELGQGSKQRCWLLGARSSKMAHHGVWWPIFLPRAVLFI